MTDRTMLLLAGVHLAVIAAMLADPAMAAAAAILHALLTLAAIRVATRADVSIAALAAAPLGPAAMLAAYATARGSRRLRPADPAVLAADPGRGPAADRRLTDRIEDDRLRPPEAEEVIRLADALRHGDVALRQSVLGVVVRNFQPALSPLIAIALTDADQAIRTQAAAAVAEIEQGLLRRRADLAARLATNPHEVMLLFDLLAEHAETNVLLSPANRTTMRRDAVEAGARAIDLLPPGEARMAAARRQAGLLCALGASCDAAALLAPLVDPLTAGDDDLAALVEAHVADRAWPALAALAATARRRRDPPSPEVAAMLAFWLDRRAA